MKHIFNRLLLLTCMAAGLNACTKDLDRFPTNDVTSDVVYSTAEGYTQAFAKLYGAFALTETQAPQVTEIYKVLMKALQITCVCFGKRRSKAPMNPLLAGAMWAYRISII